MVRIALTGPTGSGKSYFCSLLAGRGVPSLDTDGVVHRLYEDTDFAAKLNAALGTPILTAAGTVDRAKLRELLFSDEDAMKKLSSVVYPKVRGVCRSFMDNAEEKGAEAALVDAPQLFEAGFEGDFDLIIALVAPKKVRLQRIKARDGITGKAALERMAHQMPAKEYSARADLTVRNDGRTDLEEAVGALMRRIRTMNGAED